MLLLCFHAVNGSGDERALYIGVKEPQECHWPPGLHSGQKNVSQAQDWSHQFRLAIVPSQAGSAKNSLSAKWLA